MKMKFKKLFSLSFIIASILIMPMSLPVHAEEAKFEDGTITMLILKGIKQKILIYNLEYTSQDLKIKGMLFIPSGLKDKIPAIVYNHDGVSGISKETINFCLTLAKENYAVIAPSYRGEDGSEGKIEVAKGEVNDVISIIKVIEKLSFVDSEKIGMIGTSHGALISVLACEKINNIKAVIEAYGVMDINSWWYYLKKNNSLGDDQLTRDTYGNGPEDKAESFKIRNALININKINCPVLIIQGEEDNIVPLSQAKIFEDALKKYNKTYQVQTYPQTGHGFLIYAEGRSDFSVKEKEAQKDAIKTIIIFFNKYLK